MRSDSNDQEWWNDFMILYKIMSVGVHLGVHDKVDFISTLRPSGYSQHPHELPPSPRP